MEPPDDKTFTEVLATLILGALAGGLTAVFSEFIKAEYERQRDQKVVVLKQTKHDQINCNQNWRDVKLVPTTPRRCWQTHFNLSRTGSPEAIDSTLSVEARLKGANASFFWHDYRRSPDFLPADLNDKSAADQERLSLRKWEITGFREPQEVEFIVAFGTDDQSANPNAYLRVGFSDQKAIVRTSDTLFWLQVSSWALAILIVVASIVFGLFKHNQVKRWQRYVTSLQAGASGGA